MISEEAIENLLNDVADVWETNQLREGLTFNRITIDGEFFPSVSHEKMLKHSVQDRMKIRSNSNFTLGDFHKASGPARAIFENQKIRDLCSLVLDGEVEPRASLFFDKGSEQEIHQDTAVFHVYPINSFIGVWIALEDIHLDSGPLVYYPGSHKEPIWKEFVDYPQTNLRTFPLARFPEYYSYLHELKKKYPQKHAILKKGSALLWHGMLIHGGSPVNNKALTRKSLVVHVMGKDTDCHAKVVGPTNW